MHFCRGIEEKTDASAILLDVPLSSKSSVSFNACFNQHQAALLATVEMMSFQRVIGFYSTKFFFPLAQGIVLPLTVRLSVGEEHMGECWHATGAQLCVLELHWAHYNAASTLWMFPNQQGSLHTPDFAGGEIALLLSIVALALQKLPSKCVLWDCGCQEGNSWTPPTALCEDQSLVSSCLCCRGELAAHAAQWALSFPCSASLLEQREG